MKTLQQMSAAELRELIKTAPEIYKNSIQGEIDSRFPLKMVYSIGSKYPIPAHDPR